MADSRRDMWQTMVRPLFNAALIFLQFEWSKARQDELGSLWLKSFKQFLMIPKNTNTELVNEMIGQHISIIRHYKVENALEKWKARKERRDPITQKPECTNLLRGIPNDWCEILRQQFKLCPTCRTCTRNAFHMKTKHDIELISYKDIWDDIKDFMNSN